MHIPMPGFADCLTGGLMLLILLGYGCGSWLAAVSVSRWFKRLDPRLAGSANPGFSNMWRLHGLPLATLTLALDMAKAVVVVGMAAGLGFPLWYQALVGLAVMLGHSFPLWHRFQGGRSVACGMGVLLVLAWPAAVAGGLSWIVTQRITRTAAQASLASAMVMPLAAWWLSPNKIWLVLAVSAFIAIRHRDYLIRIWSRLWPLRRRV